VPFHLHVDLYLYLPVTLLFLLLPMVIFTAVGVATPSGEIVVVDVVALACVDVASVVVATPGVVHDPGYIQGYRTCSGFPFRPRYFTDISCDCFFLIVPFALLIDV
jgi:hypothetical protein